MLVKTSTTWRARIVVHGELIAVVRHNSQGTSTDYLVYDAQGSPRVMLDENGNLMARFAWNAWGELVNPQTGIGPDPDAATLHNLTTLGYTGHEMLWKAGLVHTYARLYNPHLGRWLSPDPTIPNLYNPQSLNRYSYVLNNPATLVDPLGLYSGCDSSVNICLPGMTVKGNYWETYRATQRMLTRLMGIRFANPAMTGFALAFYAYGGGRSEDKGEENTCADMGNAPSPFYYQQEGEQARMLMQVDFGTGPGANAARAGAVAAAYTTLIKFRHGGPLDAGSYGSSSNYGNYVFGVYLSAMGVDLSTTLDLADAYGYFFSVYFPSKVNMGGPDYPNIPQVNVDNIIHGYHDQKNGTLCHRPMVGSDLCEIF